MAVRHSQTPMSQRDWAHHTRYCRRQYRLIVIRALEPVLAGRRDRVTRMVRELIHQEMQGIAHAKTAFLEGRLPERFYTGVRGGAFAVIDHALRKIGGEASVARFHAELADASNMVFQKTFWNPALPAGFESRHHIAPLEPEELEGRITVDGRPEPISCRRRTGRKSRTERHTELTTTNPLTQEKTNRNLVGGAGPTSPSASAIPSSGSR